MMYLSIYSNCMCMVNLLPFFFGFQLGYRPFVEACIDADEKSEALKYIPKLTDPRERAEVIQISLKHLFPSWIVCFISFAIVLI